MKKLFLLIVLMLFLTGCGAAALGTSAYNMAQTDALTELLIKKGVISKSELTITKNRLLAENEKRYIRNSSSSGSFIED